MLLINLLHLGLTVLWSLTVHNYIKKKGYINLQASKGTVGYMNRGAVCKTDKRADQNIKKHPYRINTS